MNDVAISVVIPTHNRSATLGLTLSSLNHQVLSSDLFEVIVVSDGSTDNTSEVVDDYMHRGLSYSLRYIEQDNAGPATARNTGAKAARGKVLVFIGDDTPGSAGLLFHHYLAHTRDAKHHRAVQGLTLWHPDIPPNDFHCFLSDPTGKTATGLQANWNGLRTPDGNWKREAGGWFLTTNCSVSKEVFEWIGGFSEDFPYAAWEDIDLAVKMQKYGIETLFAPQARNFHYHKQTLDGFVKRQEKEGYSRLILLSHFPEIAGDMIDGNGLRTYSEDLLRRLLDDARLLHNDTSPETLELRRRRWGMLFQMASFKGTIDAIKERGGAWLSLLDVHLPDCARAICGCANSLDRGDTAMAMAFAWWALLPHKDNHALLALMGEVYRAIGNREQAVAFFQASVENGPGNKFARERLVELTDENYQKTA